jgi:hypothetical protein
MLIYQIYILKYSTVEYRHSFYFIWSHSVNAKMHFGKWKNAHDTIALLLCIYENSKAVICIWFVFFLLLSSAKYGFVKNISTDAKSSHLIHIFCQVMYICMYMVHVAIESIRVPHNRVHFKSTRCLPLHSDSVWKDYLWMKLSLWKWIFYTCRKFYLIYSKQRSKNRKLSTCSGDECAGPSASLQLEWFQK